MSMNNFHAPVRIFRENDKVLGIRWNDGEISRFNLRFLRLRCPCAHCVNEWTGERMIKEEHVPEKVVPEKIFSVGRYAMGIRWNDGHSSGIFSYDYLRSMPSGDSKGEMR